MKYHIEVGAGGRRGWEVSSVLDGIRVKDVRTPFRGTGGITAKQGRATILKDVVRVSYRGWEERTLECHTKTLGQILWPERAAVGFKVGAGMTKSVTEQIILAASREQGEPGQVYKLVRSRQAMS